jgi:hypothetical protein
MNSALERRFYIAAQKSDKTITLVCDGKKYVINASVVGNIACEIPEGVSYDMKADADGNLTVTFKAENGSRLESIKTSNGTELVVGSNTISAATTLKLTFAK